MFKITLSRNTILCGFLVASLFGQAPARPPKTPILVSAAILDGIVGITRPARADATDIDLDQLLARGERIGQL